MFASPVRETVAVGDVSVIIRKLSARSLEKASENRAIAAAKLSKLLGTEMMQTFKTMGDAPKVKPTPEEEDEARYAQYDRETVLTQGVESWNALDGGGRPISVEDGLKDIDEETATLLHRAVIDLSVPKKSAAKDKEKNG